MSSPTLDDVVEQLKSVAGVDEIDPDTPLLHIEDIDSLDLMEWLYGFQEQYPDIPADESLFENIDDTVTFRVIYDRIMASANAAGA